MVAEAERECVLARVEVLRVLEEADFVRLRLAVARVRLLDLRSFCGLGEGSGEVYGVGAVGMEEDESVRGTCGAVGAGLAGVGGKGLVGGANL